MSSPRRSVRVAAVAASVLVPVGAVLAACSSDDGGASSGRSASATTATASDGRDTTTTASATPTVAPTAALVAAVCAGRARVHDLGTVRSPEVTEASGIAASRRDPGVWWVHNDSGDSARVFAVDGTGRPLATVALQGARARDWEDIAVGPPVGAGGAATVYVADIGDNAMMRANTAAARPSVTVYRFTEPAVAAGTTGPASSRVRPEALQLTYPDGPHDAETLLVDPVSGDLLIVTKDWARTGSSGVYRAPAGLAAGSRTRLERVASVPVPPGTLVTGGDISPDGSVVALRSYADVRLYRRDVSRPAWTAFAGTPCSGPVPLELQGESLGFAADGGSYVTVSEGSDPVLHGTSP